MMKKLVKPKKYKQHLLIILLCICFVGSYYYFIRAAATPVVQFVADTNVALSGLSGDDLQIGTNSECAGVTINGNLLTINDVTDGSTFNFKTPAHNGALNLTPTGNTIDIILNSNNIVSDDITSWTLTMTPNTNIAHTVGVELPDTWYQVTINGASYAIYQSNSSNTINFEYYTGFGGGMKDFAVAETAPPDGQFLPSFSSPPSSPEPTPENPEGELKVIVELEEEAVITDSAGEIIVIKETTERKIILKLFAGDNVERMVVSEDPEFKDVGQEPFKELKEWTLSEGKGKKTIYVKLFTKYGIPSEIMSVDVTLLPKEEAKDIIEAIPDISETPEIPDIATTTAPIIIEELEGSVESEPITPLLKEDKTFIEEKIAIIKESIYNGITGTSFAEAAENIATIARDAINATKEFTVKAFDYTIKAIYQLLPDRVMNWLFCPDSGGCSNGFIDDTNEIEKLKNTDTGATYKGVAKTQYAILSEKITDKTKSGIINIKLSTVYGFDHALSKTYNLLPDFIVNGYKGASGWAKGELIKLFKG